VLAPHYSDQADELLSSEAIKEPQRIYARLRDSLPLSRIGGSGVHLVATWDLINEALGREEDFSANLTGVLFRGQDGVPSTFEIGGLGATDVIATADEPDHAIHRAVAQPRLIAARIHTLEDRMREWTRHNLAPSIAAGGGDFIPISEMIPALAVANILGLPEEDVARFRVWAMMGGDMLAGEVNAERLGFLGSETGKMAEYLGSHFDAAFADPSSNPDAPLLHALALAVRSGKIDRRYAIGIAIVMFGAGGESTAAMIGSALRILAEDPALASKLREEPTLIPRYIEEVLRLEPPFNFHYRSVRRDCEFAGYDLKEGNRLMLLWASANRDPKIFDEPDRLRLDRKHPKKHMGFGRGAHFCIGAHLARLEARVVIEEVLAATSDLSIRTSAASQDDTTSDAVSYTKSIFIRRLERLDLDLAAA
jgi:cytochrome P450